MTTPDLVRLGRRTLLGAVAGAGAGLALTACGGTSGPPQAGPATGKGGAEGYDGPNVELQYWNGLTGGDGPVMKKLAQKFMDAHPKIKVTTTSIAWADLFQKLPAAVQSGRAPDVCLMHTADIATNAARRVVQPIDDVVAGAKLSADDYAELVWKATFYQDKQYAIPLDIHPAGLYYNKKVLTQVGADPTKPPTTKDEFMAVLDKCKSKGVKGYWVSALSVGGLVAQSMIFQNGGYMISDDGAKTGFGDQPAIDSITFFKSLIDKDYSPKNAAGDGDWVSFSNSKAAFMISGPWMVTPCKQAKGLEWGCAPIPVLGSKEQTWAGSHCFTLPRQTNQDKNKATAARVFVNWMSQNSVGWAEAGMVPARKSVRESADFAQYTEVKQFEKMIDWAHFPPNVPGAGDTDPEWTKAISLAVTGKKPIDQALKDAAQKGDQILAANQKKYGG
ncbi:multiple sugar transport system substrate-binding protein [Kribbella sp. VKM Ac-2571]|uniref:ABC transporter substrate-binding protein n=1 Tax=Kribbella sp. VKM Ac-2571 TaxID=2512222 RepID=UPI00105DEFF7|nr:ABC transporter substrate-binding protein [Kribbella sp. VKM Ac-2571]TDO55072.1 multiple sugar transport system substrate-binding protein [Kribbella sp. VKM Ac-2571]